jgi:hypothetical protein
MNHKWTYTEIDFKLKQGLLCEPFKIMAYPPENKSHINLFLNYNSGKITFLFRLSIFP